MDCGDIVKKSSLSPTLTPTRTTTRTDAVSRRNKSRHRGKETIKIKHRSESPNKSRITKSTHHEEEAIKKKHQENETVKLRRILEGRSRSAVQPIRCSLPKKNIIDGTSYAETMLKQSEEGIIESRHPDKDTIVRSHEEKEPIKFKSINRSEDTNKLGETIKNIKKNKQTTPKMKSGEPSIVRSMRNVRTPKIPNTHTKKIEEYQIDEFQLPATQHMIFFNKEFNNLDIDLDQYTIYEKIK